MRTAIFQCGENNTNYELLSRVCVPETNTLIHFTLFCTHNDLLSVHTYDFLILQSKATRENCANYFNMNLKRFAKTEFFAITLFLIVHRNSLSFRPKIAVLNNLSLSS